MSDTKKKHDNKNNGTASEKDQADKVEELNNKYLRALADYQNLEKRTGNAIIQARMSAKKDIVTRFLDVLDDLEKAEKFVKDDGLKMIMSRFKSTLSELGVEELDVLNKEYDPYIAEAIEVVPAEGKKDNIVVEVVRKGYSIGKDVIRPAHVKVSKVTD